MAIEIERRFLVNHLPESVMHTSASMIVQGYFPKASEAPVVRLRYQGDTGFLTIKGPQVRPGECDEFEYRIPAGDALSMLEAWCPLTLRKTRYRLPHQDLVIELDVFSDALAGLAIAEVELPSFDTPLLIPKWFGREITGDSRYSNLGLAQHGIPPDA